MQFIFSYNFNFYKTILTSTGRHFKTGPVFLSLIGTCLFTSTITMASHPLADLVENGLNSKISPEILFSSLSSMAQTMRDSNGAATPDLELGLNEIYKKFYPTFDDLSQRKFQTLVGQVGGHLLDFTSNETLLPIDSEPIWLMKRGEFFHFRSTPVVPTDIDTVIIGAGLTGASAAYHLRDQAESGKKIIILEGEDQPAAQSSGKNGGNFQLLPETYTGTYDGFVQERFKWLKSQFPGKADLELWKLSEKQALTLLNLSFKNTHRFTELVKRENISCDFSPRGWLRIASSKEEERVLLQDNEWIQSQRSKIDSPYWPAMEIWDQVKIENEIHIRPEFKGRFIGGSGNYHPYKFVNGVLHNLVKFGTEPGIKLYTGVRVIKITSTHKNTVLIETERDGIIEAKKVIVATNAFTPKLFPELKEIQCVASQEVDLDHVENPLQGMTVTEKYGDVYFNFPTSTHYRGKDGKPYGTVHFGHDLQTYSEDPSQLKRSEPLLKVMMDEIHDRFPKTKGQPPARVWVGPMGFTRDRVPVIGFMFSKETHLPEKNIVIAAGFQGYGGSYCTEAGYLAAKMAIEGETPNEVPAELFSPSRFLTTD